MKRLAILLMILTMTTGCAAPSAKTCSVDTVNDTVKQFNQQITAFDDAETVAFQTPRSAMGGQVSIMQGIRRDTQSIDAPPCLKGAQEYLVQAFDARITGWLASMNSATANRTVTELLDKAAPLMQEYKSEVARVQACAPNCP